MGIYVSMPRAALCVLGHHGIHQQHLREEGFNAARGIMCVGTENDAQPATVEWVFQCRMRHYVCWDVHERSL